MIKKLLPCILLLCFFFSSTFVCSSELNHQDDIEKNIKEREVTLKGNPKDMGALLFLAQAYKEQGNIKKANFYLTELLKFYKDTEFIHIQLSLNNFDSCKYYEALRELNIAEKIAKENAMNGIEEFEGWEFSLQKARIYRGMKKYNRAIKEYNLYIENYPEEDEEIKKIKNEKNELEKILNEKEKK